MGNFSQGNITTAVSVEDVFWWYVPFAGTSSGARRSLASLLQEETNPTESVQYKWAHPSIKGFYERSVPATRCKKGRVVQRNPSL